MIIIYDSGQSSKIKKMSGGSPSVQPVPGSFSHMALEGGAELQQNIHHRTDGEERGKDELTSAEDNRAFPLNWDSLPVALPMPLGTNGDYRRRVDGVRCGEAPSSRLTNLALSEFNTFHRNLAPRYRTDNGLSEDQSGFLVYSKASPSPMGTQLSAIEAYDSMHGTQFSSSVPGNPMLNTQLSAIEAYDSMNGTQFRRSAPGIQSAARAAHAAAQ